MNLKSLLLKIWMLTGVSILCGCVPQNTGSIEIEADITEIILSGTKPYTIVFTASGEWYSRIEYIQNGSNEEESKWLTMTPQNGSEGICTATISANSANNSGTDRMANIEIRLPADASKTIRIIQPSVPKPRLLTSISRSASGNALSGPVAMSFNYDESENLVAFATGTSQQTEYRLSAVAGANTATIDVTVPGNITWSLPLRMVNDRISSTEQMLWSFTDQYTGIVLDQSAVTFSFSYDNSDNRLLQRATRTETIIMRDGETLPSPIELEETFHYAYTAVRMDSLIHVMKYTYLEDNTPTEVSDTIKYALKYPAVQDLIEDNNLTADIWDMIVFPEHQGVPFYSFTGYTILNLTGNQQPSFPEEVTVEMYIHSPEGLAREWPDNYSYAYTSTSGELQRSVTSAAYGPLTYSTLVEFSYQEVSGAED